MRRCSRASSTNTRHGSSRSSNPGRTVRFKLLSRAERAGPGVGFGRRVERGTRAKAGRAGRSSRLSDRALGSVGPDTLVPIGDLLQTVIGVWRLSGCPVHEWMPGVRRIVRCANGYSVFERVSDAQMDVRRPKSGVPFSASKLCVPHLAR